MTQTASVPAAPAPTTSASNRYTWKLLPKSPVANSRTDDIWFFDELTGWLVNSSGYVCKTEDGGANWTPKFFLAPDLPSRPYLRCMSWANRQIGWFGAVTGLSVTSAGAPSQFVRTLLHHTTDGGETWKPVENLPEGSPAGICGFHAVNERVVYGSGTNDPGLPGPAIIKTTDAGASWELIDMRPYASNLIDIWFIDESNGFVVGGLNDPKAKVDPIYVKMGYERYGLAKPVVLRTRDGGKSWKNTAPHAREFEAGEWGWKIQFVDEKNGFVSLENFRDASILVTRDGGDSWAKKHVAKDQNPKSPAVNNDLEGIGFINEREGWVGGWGFQPLNTPVGGLENSFTENGGDNWIAQNHLSDPDTDKKPNDPRYRINRYRFVKNLGGKIVSGYCSGQQVYKLTIGGDKKKGAFAARTYHAAEDRVLPANSSRGSNVSAFTTQRHELSGDSTQGEVAPETAYEFDVATVPGEDGTVQISFTLPDNTGNVFVGLWNKFAFHVRTLVSDQAPASGRQTIVWDGKDEQGRPLGAGVYILRMCIGAGKATSRMVRLNGVG